MLGIKRRFDELIDDYLLEDLGFWYYVRGFAVWMMTDLEEPYVRSLGAYHEGVLACVL